MFSRKSWPHLLGKSVDEAIAEIQNDDSSLNVIKLKEGTPVTYDLRYNRVRVFYDTNGNVSLEPSTG